MSVADLMELAENDVLALDYAVDRQVDLSINGKRKFAGRIVAAGHKRGFQIEEAFKL